MAVNSLFGWEINTHRAIERKAIEASQNLKTFVENSGISTDTSFYNNEKFEGYHKNNLGDYTYTDYITNGEKNGISDKRWNQKFPYGKPSYQKMIEAGSILEDAQWPHSPNTLDFADRADGRFVNHFYDAQNGGKGLVTYDILEFQNVLKWATEGIGSKPIYLVPPTEIPYISTLNAMLNGISHRIFADNNNDYRYISALNYFKLAFTSNDLDERKRYQAKLFVSLGQLMHFMNDMTSPAHTRDDNHPEGDIMEKYGRGGDNGSKLIGYRVNKQNQVKNYIGVVANQATNIPKYSKFSDFITQEATWTATHFFSKDTIFTKPLPSVGTTYEFLESNKDGVKKYYIKSDGTGNVGCNDGCVPIGTKLAIGIKSWLIDELELYYPERVVGKTTTFKGDYSVLKENAKVLIPRAIANARNFLDYFFRGQIEAKIDGSNITIKNISVPSLVKDGHTVTINPGTFYIKYYTTGNVSGTGDGIFHDFEFTLDLARYTQNIALIGTYSEAFPPVYKNGFSSLVTLAPGDSIVVPIKKDTSIIHKNIVVIYDGIIGNERGLAVCAAQTPSAMHN